TSNYTVTYYCVIGIDTSSPAQPYISRDIPSVCNPRGALGHAPVTSDFQGTGDTRYSACSPSLGDKCNTVQINASQTTQSSFGRGVGVNSGSTGPLASTSCTGPCGNPPDAPVDLVILIDRTASMSDSDVQATKDAADAILGVYDPS